MVHGSGVVSQKLMLIGHLRFCPIPTLYFITGITRNHLVRRNWRNGNEYQRPLEAPLEPTRTIASACANWGRWRSAPGSSSRRSRLKLTPPLSRWRPWMPGKPTSAYGRGLGQRSGAIPRLQRLVNRVAGIENWLAQLQPEACAGPICT